ncbi:MAG: tRNA uridine-5-carboxymethylaminomethyl(34) synthesis GTPase MnmE [Paludibacteraceae bacterium]|nr:tRNA uridine-5-carboxymethylaminomethyl(34) synthesis GTPase MnmE [Paludibacteraceae bacterium]
MQTICAISTPHGAGGIAVVRVSGDAAIRIADTLFQGKQRLMDIPNNISTHGYIVRDGVTLDEVMVTVFRAPHSFTGEDTVEIACHGSLYVQQELVQWLINAGCRMAKGGEFTQRAFINGKMDLSQAEAVADLIAAETRAEKDLALNQLRGGISNEIADIRERLLKLSSLLELELDFADHEELEFADRSELLALADRLEQHLTRLTDSFETGNAIKNGIRVAIAGKTNAGKSTLLNALVGEDRAIVSDIAGTTRDTIEDRIVVDGQLLLLTDTAGLRETNDQIEQLGIERSHKAIEKAQIIIEVIDATNDVPCIEGDNVVHVFNKIDLMECKMQDPNPAPFPHRASGRVVYMSAKNGEVSELIEILREMIKTHHHEGAIVSNARHYEALCRAKKAIIAVKAGLEETLSGEFISMDLKDCLDALGEITGQITSQEVLNNIFSKFCIGK